MKLLSRQNKLKLESEDAIRTEKHFAAYAL